MAVLVATLFTAWTPAGLIPGGLEQFQIITPGHADSPAATVKVTQPASPRIGLIAGHWSTKSEYYDPGAVCSEALGGTKEVDVNYDVAARTQQMLEAQGYDVEILEEWDDQLSLYRGMALVSIHTDSCDYINESAKGFKVAPSSANTISERLAACLIDRYARITQMPLHPGITPDMTSYHVFAEIHNETPAAIIEIGFLNGDHEILTTDPGRIASGIANGILCLVRNEAITPPATQTPKP